ncbi:TBC1 domain family member 7 [Larimichthys crocea]|uniref:Uncharacterized protein n=1 Tax=Larimichthys crocea TaxID=215358 RepID=A0ACD3RMU2_LARCR|nr:TBC1 domain family member 7 [Larimichthys crocea]
MADDPQRNFRSAYYEKVGFRGVEEKKSLEILLKDNPLDLEKLSTFSQRFPLPSMYRIHVWKVLLGILPPHSDSHTLVGGYRKEQYQDILEALEVMRYINSSTPSTHVYLRMFQLESQVLPRCSETSPPDEENEDFLSISRAMEEIVDDPIDCYWLIKCFVNQFHMKFGDSVPASAKEPGALSESGGASTAEPSEEQRRSGSAAVRPLVQTLLRWLPARIQPAEGVGQGDQRLL